MELVSLIIGAVATLVSLAVVLRNRQLSRAQLRLHLGVTALSLERPRNVQRRAKRLVVYGIPQHGRDYFLLPIVIGLENRTALSINALHIQLEYAAECLLEGSRVRDSSAGSFTLNNVEMPGRVAKKFADVAHVTFDIDLLRSKEKRAIFEVVRVPRGRAIAGADDLDQSALDKEWGALPRFAGAVQFRVSIWASNCDPAAMKGVIAACYASDEHALTPAAQQLIARLWGQYKPVAGWWRRWIDWRRSWTLEHAELVLLASDALNVEKVEVNPFVLRRAPHAVLQFAIPPWGFTAKPFDAPGITRRHPDPPGA